MLTITDYVFSSQGYQRNLDMNLYDYTLLCHSEKIDLLYNHGVYVGKRKVNGKTVVLYQLEGFYVQIFYKVYRRYISNINFFTSTKRLQPYLDQIDVAELTSCVSRS